MPTNLQEPHGDTVAYSAMCFHVEAMDNLLDLYGKGFHAIKQKKEMPANLMSDIEAAKAEVDRAREKQQSTKTWALQSRHAEQ